MKTVRVSVTAIENYLYWLGRDDRDMAYLLQELRGEMPKSPAMMIGSALHKALEHAPIGEASFIEADGHRFIIQPNVELSLPDIQEFKLEQEFSVSSELTVQLVGKVDAWHGNTVWDHKTANRFDADKMEGYLSSYQWRWYLLMTGVDVFQYNIFVVDSENWTRLENATAYNVTDFHSFRLYRYPGMERDCIEKLKAFAECLSLEAMELPMISLLPQYCTLQALLKANR